jgi:hypothetical protein
VRKGTSSSALKESPPHRHSKPTDALRDMMEAMRRSSSRATLKACKGTLPYSIVLGGAHGVLANRSPCPRMVQCVSRACAHLPLYE